jgi:hypothetical protein
MTRPPHPVGPVDEASEQRQARRAARLCCIERASRSPAVRSPVEIDQTPGHATDNRCKKGEFVGPAVSQAPRWMSRFGRHAGGFPALIICCRSMQQCRLPGLGPVC